mmetsp:Transcript_35092/g.101432  ORF Transcript_35092/g.101432 Transcript_35092/m.101432 type:complete len:202 (-) Transcript_35092:780-1385(-)
MFRAKRTAAGFGANGCSLTPTIFLSTNRFHCPREVNNTRNFPLASSNSCSALTSSFSAGVTFSGSGNPSTTSSHRPMSSSSCARSSSVSQRAPLAALPMAAWARAATPWAPIRPPFGPRSASSARIARAKCSRCSASPSAAAAPRPPVPTSAGRQPQLAKAGCSSPSSVPSSLSACLGRRRKSWALTKSAAVEYSRPPGAE